MKVALRQQRRPQTPARRFIALVQVTQAMKGFD
jgi:hypothetical protein